jgi:hypothetical protein
MVKLTVLYGNPEDPAAFEEYYANTERAAFCEHASTWPLHIV